MAARIGEVLRVAMAAILVSAACAVAAEKPTETGDPIGSVTMLPDRSLEMYLRSVQCDGMIAKSGRIVIPPSAANYASIIEHVGGIKPSETKTALGWPAPPCPAGQDAPQNNPEH